jgi:hypothetical protein
LTEAPTKSPTRGQKNAKRRKAKKRAALRDQLTSIEHATPNKEAAAALGEQSRSSEPSSSDEEDQGAGRLNEVNILHKLVSSEEEEEESEEEVRVRPVQTYLPSLRMYEKSSQPIVSSPPSSYTSANDSRLRLQLLRHLKDSTATRLQLLRHLENPNAAKLQLLPHTENPSATPLLISSPCSSIITWLISLRLKTFNGTAVDVSMRVNHFSRSLTLASMSGQR